MISKLFKWVSARIVAAFALALPLAAMAATPYAVWDGAVEDFNFSELTRRGYKLGNLGGGYMNTVAADSSYLQVGNNNAGAAITLKKADGTAMGASTVIMKCENLPTADSYNRAVAAFLSSDAYNGSHAFIGIARMKNGSIGETAYSGAGVYIWKGEVWNASSAVVDPVDNVFSHSESAKTIALSYSQANGTSYYVDGTRKGARTDLRSTGYAPAGVVLGGVDTTGNGKFYPMVGMKITAIAFFGEKLSDDDVAAYKFPSDVTPLTVTQLNTLTAAGEEGSVDKSFASIITMGSEDEAPSAASKTFLTDSSWGGIVKIDDVTLGEGSLADFGSANSTISIVGGGVTYDQLAADTTVPSALTGSGAITITATPDPQKSVNFTGDCSHFAGSVTIPTTGNARVVFGSQDVVGNGNCLVVATDASVNIASGKTWTAPGGFVIKGTLTVAGSVNAGSDKFYGDGVVVVTDASARTGMRFAESFTGTVKIAYKPGNSRFVLNDFGSSTALKSTVEIVGVNGEFDPFPYSAWSGGSAPTINPAVVLSANWTVSDGSAGSGNVTTFKKLSGTGNLIVNGTTSGSDEIYYTIDRLENFTGTLGGKRGKFTIGTIVASENPKAGTKLVKCTATYSPELANTEIEYNGVVVNPKPTLEFRANDGIYVKTLATLDKGDGEEALTYTRVVDALSYAYINVPASTGWVVTVLDDTWVDDGTYDSYFVWDSDARTYTVKAFVARIMTTHYASLADAVSAANAGDTIVMLADDRVSFADVQVADGVPSNGSIVIDKSLTINGNGYTVYGVSDANILNATGAATPGFDMAADLVDGTNLIGFFVKSGDVTFQDITLTEFGDTAYVNKFGYDPIQTATAYSGNLTLTNVNISKFNRTAVCVRGGTLTITGGTIAANATNKDVVEQGKDYFQQPVEVRGGTATIDGVTITGGNAFESKANGGGAIVAWGNTTLTDVVVDFAGVGVWSDTPVVTISGGDTSITATDKAIFVEEGGTISVGAGTFNGALAVDTDVNSSIAISGGTYSVAVDPAYCVEGFEPMDNGDGTYTVSKSWIYEKSGYNGFTGTWSKDLTYDVESHKAAIEDGNTYTAARPSDGRFVTLNMTMSFDGANDDDTDLSSAKAAIRLGAGETDGTYVFQLATTGTVDNVATQVWATATGFTPEAADEDYNLLFVLDLTTQTYTASVITDAGATTNALSVAGSTTIAFANYNLNAAATAVREIEFIGSGTLTSLTGSYEAAPEPEDFVEGEGVTLSDGTADLTAGQAAWLNDCGAKAVVSSVLSGMSSDAFNKAYLLNLNITGDFSYEFTVSAIEVKDTTVDVTVTLTRTGALADNEVAKPIIGTLTLKGTAALGTEFQTIGSQALEFDEDADFGEGATTTVVTIDTSKTDAKFYQPTIE